MGYDWGDGQYFLGWLVVDGIGNVGNQLLIFSKINLDIRKLSCIFVIVKREKKYLIYRIMKNINNISSLGIAGGGYAYEIYSTIGRDMC